jgi:hypothetical protein
LIIATYELVIEHRDQSGPLFVKGFCRYGDTDAVDRVQLRDRLDKRVQPTFGDRIENVYQVEIGRNLRELRFN